jgi:hypothetical protein
VHVCREQHFRTGQAEDGGETEVEVLEVLRPSKLGAGEHFRFPLNPEGERCRMRGRRVRNVFKPSHVSHHAVDLRTPSRRGDLPET